MEIRRDRYLNVLTLVPKYMLPNIYEKLEALPYNANGKIDRVQLKERYLHAKG